MKKQIGRNLLLPFIIDRRPAWTEQTFQHNNVWTWSITWRCHRHGANVAELVSHWLYFKANNKAASESSGNLKHGNLPFFYFLIGPHDHKHEQKKLTQEPRRWNLMPGLIIVVLINIWLKRTSMNGARSRVFRLQRNWKISLRRTFFGSLHIKLICHFTWSVVARPCERITAHVSVTQNRHRWINTADTISTPYSLVHTYWWSKNWMSAGEASIGKASNLIYQLTFDLLATADQQGSRGVNDVLSRTVFLPGFKLFPGDAGMLFSPGCICAKNILESHSDIQPHTSPSHINADREC